MFDMQELKDMEEKKFGKGKRKKGGGGGGSGGGGGGDDYDVEEGVRKRPIGKKKAKKYKK
jgi:hypothetical protein